MPKFAYTTINGQGKKTSGTQEFGDMNACAAHLREQGRIITSLREIEEAATQGPDARGLLLLGPLYFVRSSDIALMFRLLSALVTSGITITGALQVLQRQTGKRALQSLLGRILGSIEQGSTFADALREHPRFFNSFIVSMVESGEMGGTLDVILERIADYLEERAALRAQVVTGLIYPVVVLVMVVVVVSFIVGFVVPRFMPVIARRGGNLPWNTQLLIDGSSWLRGHWMHMAAGAAAVLLGAFVLRRFRTPRYWMDRLKLRVPVIGPVFAYSLAVRFARNLGSLVASGINMLDSLRSVRHTLGNEAALRVLEGMEQRVAAGESLHQSVRDAPFVFTPLVAEMIAVGEETGALDDSLNVTAQIHEKLLQTYVKRLNVLIEPAVILILGALVGFVAWGLIAGLLSMYTI